MGRFTVTKWPPFYPCGNLFEVVCASLGRCRRWLQSMAAWQIEQRPGAARYRGPRATRNVVACIADTEIVDNAAVFVEDAEIFLELLWS